MRGEEMMGEKLGRGDKRREGEKLGDRDRS